ncbi:UNVERIFIED_ORG: basic amino acid/polyamine antiporter (APA) family transporter [Pseudomonas vranovensis]|nr:basic amino acid/polyamine antiporter (APA) family transporter [Pseudomonas vranovensis]
MSEPGQKLRLGALIALVVGSMIGGGIFSLPQNMAARADVGAVLIGWGITAVGMLALAFVFQTLANRKPELDSGVYAYAKAGFGDYMGFSSAWGYWISAWLGNVGYFVLLFSTLGFYFPVFGEGNTPIAIACASLLLWAVHFLVLRGIKEAAFINQVTTVAKIVPLVMFIVIAAVAFRADIFTRDIWGMSNPKFGGVLDQVRNMMLVTVFVFIGIEGASVYSGRAAKRSDVGKATVVGFLGVLALLVLVNVLSLGVMTQPELAALQNPSLASVLEHIVGPWGALLISIGLAVSLLGALLSWALLCAEILFATARDQTMPRFLARENANHVPLQCAVADQRDDSAVPADHAVLCRDLHQPDLPGVVDDPGALSVVGGLCGIAGGARGIVRRAPGGATQGLGDCRYRPGVCDLAVVRRRAQVPVVVGAAVRAGGDPVRQGQA